MIDDAEESNEQNQEGCCSLDCESVTFSNNYNGMDIAHSDYGIRLYVLRQVWSGSGCLLRR